MTAHCNVFDIHLQMTYCYFPLFKLLNVKLRKINRKIAYRKLTPIY